MNLSETVSAALRSLSSNRLRSALTTFGIVIGVAAVITLVALGNGMKVSFDQQFSRLANQITITSASGAVPNGGTARNLTDADVEALRNRTQAPDIASVTPSMSANVALTVGQTTERASMLGVTGNYLDLVDRTLAAGNWFTQAQESNESKDAVLGEQAIELLWGRNFDITNVIGANLRINTTRFVVTGVLQPDGQNDNSVLVPFSTSRAYLVGNHNGEINQLIIKSTTADTVDDASDEATAILDKQHYIRIPAARDFNVHDFATLLTQRTQFLDFLRLFIVAIAAISLFVGGIGVANIMLVSVTERTREIGIRKAIGAPRRAIMKQFLTEAVVLTGFGGTAGVVVGVGLCLLGVLVLPKQSATFPAPVLTAVPVYVSFAVSLAIGLIAGTYPASRAARMRPIEALRFE
jgi:putative ABC transport system permease protein